MSLTITRRTRTYDETANTSSSATTTIVGSAVRVTGNPETYKALSLVESESPTLFFTPDTYGDTPKVGDTLPWRGPDGVDLTYTIKSVSVIAPDGFTIAARLVVGR